MPPFLIGVAVGVGAQFADVYLNKLVPSPLIISFPVQVGWTDAAVLAAAVYFSPKGAGVGVVAGFALGVWLQSQLVKASTPGAAPLPKTPAAIPPGVSTAPGAGAAVTNPGPGFTNVVFSSGGGAGQM